MVLPEDRPFPNCDLLTHRNKHATSHVKDF